MAIRNENTETLTNITLNGPKVTDIKKPSKKEEEQPEKKSDTPEKVKKTRFLPSVLDELKKVEWPTFNYVAKWSVIIVLFTAIFAVSLSAVDKVYESGVKFVNCTSPQGKNQFFDNGSVSVACFKEFAENVTGQKS